MADITTSYSHTYDIRFIIDPSPDFARIGEIGLEKQERLFLVIDKNIRSLYGEKLLGKLPAMETFIHEVEAVEYSKSIDYYPVLVDFLEEHTAGRYDAVLVIGGGILLVTFAMSGIAVAADIILVLGAAIIAFAVGLLLLWTGFWLILTVFGKLVSFIIGLGRRICMKEAER